MNPQKILLNQLTERDEFKELTLFQASLEQKQLKRANDFLELAGLETRIDVPDPNERADQLLRGIKALASGELPTFVAKEYARTACSCDPKRITGYVNLTPDEWDEQKETWRDSYAKHGVDAPTDDIAAKHVQKSFGITIDEFEREIVRWDDEREEAALEQFFGGQPETSDRPTIFRGLDTADHALQLAYDEMTES